MNSNLQKIIAKISQQQSYRLAFMGDSLTSAEWVHPNWREIVEFIVKEELTAAMGGDWKTSEWFVRGINCGFDGSTSADLLNLLDEEILDYKPDLVISLWGGNDLHSNITPEQHRNNIEILISRITEKSELVFCSTLPSSNLEYSKEYEPYHVELAELFARPGQPQFIDLYKIYENFPLEKIFTFKSVGGIEELGIKPGDIDFAHPNQLGNAYIAKVVLKEVWGIEFDPEVYINSTLAGDMIPKY